MLDKAMFHKTINLPHPKSQIFSAAPPLKEPEPADRIP